MIATPDDHVLDHVLSEVADDIHTAGRALEQAETAVAAAAGRAAAFSLPKAADRLTEIVRRLRATQSELLEIADAE